MKILKKLFKRKPKYDGYYFTERYMGQAIQVFDDDLANIISKLEKGSISFYIRKGEKHDFKVSLNGKDIKLNEIGLKNDQWYKVIISKGKIEIKEV